eukprot:jgi/Mesvir1/14565/Mv05247-RA.1
MDGGVMIPNHAETAGKGFELNNIHFSVDVYRFQEDVVGQVFASRLAEGGTLPFRWKTWQSTKQSIGTQSIYSIKSSLSSASASKLLAIQVAAGKDVDNDGDNAMFDHIADGLIGYQYDINGSHQSPAYRMGPTEAWVNLVSAFNDQGNSLSCVRDGLDAAQWTASDFIMACHLNMPCAGPEYQSGLDLRGTAAVVTLRVDREGTGAPDKVITDSVSYIFCELEAKMDVGAGRQAAVYL